MLLILVRFLNEDEFHNKCRENDFVLKRATFVEE